MTKGVFLIGTDRDVGKTMVGAGLVALLRERGRMAALMTPISTGGAVESARNLLEESGTPDLARRLINPIQFETLAAPYVASLVEQSPIDPKVVLDAFEELTRLGFFVVVEGGGAMVPIRNDYFMLDLLKDMNLPSIIVARSSRGTINHSLLTTRVMAASGLTPLGFVLNGYGRFGEGFAESLNADTLAELVPDIPVLANLEWRPSYGEDFQLFVRELGRQQALKTLLEKWT
ncbi:MAG: dethiobiotin synthase [Rhodothermia bacterium]